MGTKPNLDDYNDVSSRMAEFFEKHPDGSLQSDIGFQLINDRWAAVVKASAYRTPEDPHPGQGSAYEFIPGGTPYTKDSELQNAETAAWGRAIMAVGAADSRKGIASREEVRNRTAENVIDNLEGRQALRAVCDEFNLDPNVVALRFERDYNKPAKLGNNSELTSFARLLKAGLVSVEPEPQPA